MQIASIDPGVQTGLVICSLIPKRDKILLKLTLRTTTNHILSIFAEVITRECQTVLIEKRPNHGSNLGLKAYTTLMACFDTHKYSIDTSLKMHIAEYQQVHMISPGMWKPFMASRDHLIPKADSQHEKDALMLLFYFVQFNTDRKVYFA